MQDIVTFISDVNEQIKIMNKQVTNSEPINVNTVLKKNKPSQNNYHLQQFQYKQNCINYKKDLKKKKSDITTINSTEELIELIEKYDYKKKWIKLDNYQKKQKINEYILNLSINEEEKEKMKNIYLINLNNKLFNNKVNYDINLMKIIEIKFT